MILIVDDKTENILPLQKILELHGFETDAAESGEEALKKTLKNNYALIIMDVQMPGMDGFEVAEALSGSSRTKDIPVIFLSAINKEKKYISKGYETGAVDYITKPVDPDLLMLKVKMFFKLYQQQNELKATRDLLAKEIEIRKEAQENLEVKVNERTRELLDKNEELELKNHELQQFAWVVSHDLKEPIRKIEIFIRLLKEKFVPDDSLAVDYIDRTIRASERMTKLISDLLEYSRLSSDAIPESINLNDLVAEVLSDLDYQAEQKNAHITVQPLPTLSAVPSQIRQIFQNLIGNAIKFSRPEAAPQISIDCERIAEKAFNSTVSDTGDYYQISVSDNGIGFEEMYLDKIFVIFQRLNDRESYEGTGIGLAIAKKIIEKHNGLITAKSKPGEGSVFKIILPVQQNT